MAGTTSRLITGAASFCSLTGISTMPGRSGILSLGIGSPYFFQRDNG
jgi:hypothetical protein